MLICLFLRYFFNDIRCKTVLMTKDEYDRMVNSQFSRISGITNQMLDNCPRRHGLYVVHVFFCRRCCVFDWPNPFGQRSFRNCMTFIDSINANPKVWHSAKTALSNHVDGKYSATHKLQTKSHKMGINTNSTAMYNLFVCHIHNMKRNGSDTGYTDNVAMAHKLGSFVGNRPHSAYAVPIFEEIQEEFVKFLFFLLCFLCSVCF